MCSLVINPRSHIRCQRTKPLKLNVKELVPLLVLEIFPLPRGSMSVSETTTHQSSILCFIITSCKNLSYQFALRTSRSRVCRDCIVWLLLAQTFGVNVRFLRHALEFGQHNTHSPHQFSSLVPANESTRNHCGLPRR